jgi:hypothetical protein
MYGPVAERMMPLGPAPNNNNNNSKIDGRQNVAFKIPD